jgi:hypothetical protein
MAVDHGKEMSTCHPENMLQQPFVGLFVFAFSLRFGLRTQESHQMHRIFTVFAHHGFSTHHPFELNCGNSKMLRES